MRHKKVQALIRAIQERPSFMNMKLAKAKKIGPARAKEPDFVWKGILRALYTWRGIPANYSFEDAYPNVTYDKLRRLSEKELRAELKRVFWHQWGFLRERKLDFACSNLRKITALGGSTLASKKALKCKSADEKISFMRQFDGFDKKYPRDFWMNLYDPDFRDSIAVDARLKNILKALGLEPKLKNYDEQESFFRDMVAKPAGVSAWELDRLLFNFMPFFIWAIEAVD